ncbi:hypothetical protein PCASD_00945 [Puccinia coronata f. sp. avenae]|uniref:Uncharacterized protein n=1 Tax=Puccinia coronata f. sp. avenae TaxID=200324 RepID=A0A2N5VMN2_9BASI|nr:hypothetical protein PCASD_00945 [Puccinia coronata f. sp. avenae]
MSIPPPLWEDMPIIEHDLGPDGAWEASPLRSPSAPPPGQSELDWEWLSLIQELGEFQTRSPPEFSSAADIHSNSHYLQDLPLSLDSQSQHLNSKKRKHIAEQDGSSISSPTKQPHSIHGVEPAFPPREILDYAGSQLGEGVYSSSRGANTDVFESYHHGPHKDSQIHLDASITEFEPAIMEGYIHEANQDSTSYVHNPMIESNRNFLDVQDQDFTSYLHDPMIEFNQHSLEGHDHDSTSCLLNTMIESNHNLLQGPSNEGISQGNLDHLLENETNHNYWKNDEIDNHPRNPSIEEYSERFKEKMKENELHSRNNPKMMLNSIFLPNIVEPIAGSQNIQQSTS